MARRLYFGCVDRPGHYLWVPGPLPAPGRWPYEELLPRVIGEGLDTEQFLHMPDNGTRGWSCSVVAGWSILARWDRSVDTRPGAKALFLFKGEKGFRELKRLAAKHFPRIWERIGAEEEGLWRDPNVRAVVEEEDERILGEVVDRLGDREQDGGMPES